MGRAFRPLFAESGWVRRMPTPDSPKPVAGMAPNLLTKQFSITEYAMPKKQNWFERLFDLYQGELLGFAGQRFDDSAEDIVQDAYLRLLEHEQPDAILNPRAYLYRVTANAAVDQQRKRRIRELYAGDLEDFDAVCSPLPSPETESANSQLLQQCLQVLEQLPAIQRHIFLLHRIEGYSHRQIAANLNMPRRTVERHCAKALEFCLAALDGEN